MTTLLAWLSVDQQGPSAVNIITDSKLTWPPESYTWDCARKTFATRSSSDIFGYWGEALFPSLMLGTVCDFADRNLLWANDASAFERHQFLYKFLQDMHPDGGNRPTRSIYDFGIIHAAKDGCGNQSTFRVWQIDYDARQGQWSDRELEETQQNLESSKIIALRGSGRSAFNEIRKRADPGQMSTARSLFWSFCDLLERGGDTATGGAPQLVSIDRASKGRVLGIAINGQRYLQGIPVDFHRSLEDISWVDERFQTIHPQTLERRSNAPRYGRGKPGDD